MSEEDDSTLEEDVEVEEMLEVGFGEVEFEEIKVGFEDEHEVEELSEDLTDEDLREFLALGFLADVFGPDYIKSLGLEETLSGFVANTVVPGKEGELGRGDFYKTKIDVGDFYDNDIYAVSSGNEVNYDGFVEMDDVNTLVREQEPSQDIFVESEAVRQRDRSVLEIAGFRDEEAEKKRKEKRERFW